ncbi:hypothetical protein [Bradyrhizobium sp. Ai1a-2]|uniref:hypothetical protein n=1 Tax=Bradyrhizobium sp. Ai1a-2 TaxID=196490 RepID=UPI000489BA4E|nr:hypothetical protein [Bradyrhizobium sp. Ai1a-2]
MPRGIIVLFVQLFVCVGVTALGCWALLWPKRLQRFLNTNFALLPEVREGRQVAPIMLRLIGLFLIWYGYTLVGAYHAELLWLARLFGIVAPAPGA